MFHLSLRVAWHDSSWNGTVCKKPSCNSFCCELDRIAAEKISTDEEIQAGKHFSILTPAQQPPCRAESVAFMSGKEWTRFVQHPYQESTKCLDTHGHLRPTSISVPSYSTFTVPFWWMLTKNQEAIDAGLPEPLPPDEPAPFPSPWVFGRARQDALVNLFFEQRLKAQESLVLFYSKAAPVSIFCLITLGMMAKKEYSDGWQRRKAQYLASGFLIDENLFTSEDGPDGSLNAQTLAKIATKIQQKI